MGQERNNTELRKKVGGLKGLVAGTMLGLTISLPASLGIQWRNGLKPSENPIRTMTPAVITALASYVLGRKYYQSASPVNYYEGMQI
jgi:hypothetical protein